MGSPIGPQRRCRINGGSGGAGGSRGLAIHCHQRRQWPAQVGEGHCHQRRQWPQMGEGHCYQRRQWPAQVSEGHCHQRRQWPQLGEGHCYYQRPMETQRRSLRRRLPQLFKFQWCQHAKQKASSDFLPVSTQRTCRIFRRFLSCVGKRVKQVSVA